MRAILNRFDDEQLRALINIQPIYESWMAAERDRAGLVYNLKWKTISGRDYLYEVVDRMGNGKSLGPRSDETERAFAEYRDRKEGTQARLEQVEPKLRAAGAIYRALRLPMLTSEAANILREIDRRGLMGSHLVVVGTNCMPAYMIEAAGRIIGAPDETQDFDLAWSAKTPDTDDPTPVWDMLKAVDPTFTVNAERTFQARNASAYEVELLAAPSRIDGMGNRDRPHPIPLPEQEWLLLGRYVDRVLVARDGTACRVVAPDPRWFALQKLWLSDQAKRNPLKRPKDLLQGNALLDIVEEAMPQFPLDAEFQASIPNELVPYFARWRDVRK